MNTSARPTAAHPFTDGRPPHLPCGPGDVCADVLLPGDPDRVAMFAGMLDDLRDFGRRREYALVSGTYRGHPLTICSSGIGGPSTEIALVELAMLGARRVVRVGGMSSLVAEIPTGAFLCVRRAIGESSVARLYGDGTDAAADPAPALHDAIRATALPAGKAMHSGTVASTDSYYLGQDRLFDGSTHRPETHHRLDDLQNRGAVGVDMECQSVLAVSRRLGLSAACLLGVHGNRATDDWLIDYEPTQRDLLHIAGAALSGKPYQPN